MNTLNLDLENCYGINKLTHEFSFADTKVHLIYAPNGVMKSSFALTFEDIAENRVTTDRIFKSRVNRRNVSIDGVAAEKDDIFVIQRLKDATFKDATTILANNELRERYAGLNEKVGNAKTDFIKALQPFLGIKENLIEMELIAIFGGSFLKILEELKDLVEAITTPNFVDIIYNEVFNEKILKFLQGKNFNKKISDYIEIYDSLVNKNESLFVKGTFNHYNADTVSKTLKENKFFIANHKVKIKDLEIDNIAQLEELIASEREKVLNDPDLKGKFDEIDKALNSNVELRRFRSYIEQNQEILVEFSDLGAFRKKLIINYVASIKTEFQALLKVKSETDTERQRIIEEANLEQEDWKKVLKVFRERFSVPFELRISNQHDVILNDKPASLIFRYTDPLGHVDLGGPELQQSLSTGEQRVFYLLNIIFQIEVKRRSGRKQLVIVDDIADSFDYKNKYAIIQYLKDISEEDNFYMIVLTHNFDFYKTFKSRLGGRINFSGNWMAVRELNEIKLYVGEKKDVFPLLRAKFGECDLTFISCIPFVRNLIEFTIGTENNSYLALTSLLHMKPARVEEGIASSVDIEKGHINTIFNSVFDLQIGCDNPEKKVLSLIMEKAAEIIANNELDFTDLKVKLCLSLAIRLKAEEYMISKITNPVFVEHIHKKQTGMIVKAFRSEFPEETEILVILDAVNLMTAENIHVNSFMYEPLMDLSIDHLRRLYNSVFALN